jgi:hypothetical protein
MMSPRVLSLEDLMRKRPREKYVAAVALESLRSAKWHLATDIEVQTTNLEIHLHAVERVPSEGRGQASQFIPIHFTFASKLTQDDKLFLALDAFALSKTIGRNIPSGKIIMATSTPARP